MTTQYIYDLTDTWNSSGTVFNGIKMNVTDSASAAGSRLFDLQKGGVTQFNVDKNGNVGIGITPSAWWTGTSAWRAINLGQGASLSSRASTEVVYLSSNWYFDGVEKYISNGTATQYMQNAGGHIWKTASSGTAGSAISFTQSMTLDTNGRLGIGATSPMSRLTIDGTNGNVASQIQLVGTGVLSGYIGPSADGLNLGTDSGGILFRTGVTGNASVTTGTERMRIDAAGNVGIGTTSLSGGKLSVNSGASATSNSLLLFSSDGTYNPYLQIEHSSAGVKIFNSSSYGSPSNNLIFGNGNIPETMRIDSAGNVGIGTTTPGQKLEVSGSAYFTGGVAGQGAHILRDGATGGGVYSSQTGNTNLVAPGANSVIFQTNSAERMRIDSSGNVGIGTTTPGAKLDVAGAKDATNFIVSAPLSTVGGGAFTNYSELLFKNTAAANSDAAIRAYGNAWSSAGSVLSFLTSNNSAVTERMRLDASGNLGLGVTPSAWAGLVALELPAYGHVAAANTQLNFAVNAYYNGGYKYKNNGSATFFNANTDSFTWNIAPSGTAGNAISFTQAMTLDASGRLGIGVTSPTSMLTIGSGTLTAAAANTSGLYTDASLGLVVLTDGLFVGARGGTGRFQIDTSGNVIVNTAAIATTATNGFLYVPSCAGTPTGTPTAYTGRVPIVVDTTNNKLYFYSGGQWRDAGP